MGMKLIKDKKYILILSFCIIIFVSIVSYASINIYKCYAIGVKKDVCLNAAEYYDLDVIAKNAVCVTVNENIAPNAKQLLLGDGGYLLVYSDELQVLYNCELNCYYQYEKGILNMIYFSIKDFPGEEFVRYYLE